jgi:Ser/Thr protein kinase RdoA (MazF antagonist)
VTFPVQSSTLSAEGLADFVREEYGLPHPVRCRFWRKGMADTYEVSAGGKAFYFKAFLGARRSQKDVTEEVRLLLHLLADGIGVCEPVRSVTGRYVLTLHAPEGDRNAVLYRSATGLEGTTELHRRSMGKMVARMHKSADRLQPSYGRNDLELEYLLDDNLAAIGRLMIHRKEDLRLVERIAAHARKLVTSSLPVQAPEHGVCHGDLHGGDVLYSPQGEPVIFDFESSGNGYRVLDLAVFGGSPDWMDTSEQGQLVRHREVGDFLDGYSEVRTLSEGERCILSLDGAVHHIYLMGIVLRYWTVRDGWHWANDEFINWHMKWFRHWEQHHEM